MGTVRKVIIFLCSVRESRRSDTVALFVRRCLEQEGLSVKYFDPAELCFPMLKTPIHFYPDPCDAPEWLKSADEEIQQADGFVVVTTEYNSGIPPALSNMLDHFPPSSYGHRPCGICTYSSDDLGGVRVQTIIQPFLVGLGMVLVPRMLRICCPQRMLDTEGNAVSDKLQHKGTLFAKYVEWYVEALARQNEICKLEPETPWDV